MPPFLEALCSAIEEAGLPVLVRPVDDGSGEREAELMRETVAGLRPEHPCLSNPVLLAENQGKGGAVYSGWDSADDEGFAWLGFVDADGAVSPSETVRFLLEVSEHRSGDKSALFAVRVSDAGTEVKRTPLRKVLGNTFRLLVRTTFRLPVRDTQCGLKAVPAAAYREIRPKLRERRFVFDVELAARLVRSGVAVREFPISWHESPGTRMKLSSATRMLFALVGVRWRLTVAP